MLFDFQACHVRSPVTDIVNFLAGSTDSEARAEHMDEYLDVYYESMSRLIRSFGSDPDEMMTREEFDHELKRNAFSGLIGAIVFLPNMICEPNSTWDMDKLAECVADETQDVGEQSSVVLDEEGWKVLRKRLTGLLGDAEKFGWLDELKKM